MMFEAFGISVQLEDLENCQTLYARWSKAYETIHQARPSSEMATNVLRKAIDACSAHRHSGSFRGMPGSNPVRRREYIERPPTALEDLRGIKPRPVAYIETTEAASDLAESMIRDLGVTEEPAKRNRGADIEALVTRTETQVPKTPKWTLRPDLISYVVDSYAGVEPNDTGQKRRVFLWEEADGTISMGNCEAFVLHLGTRYELPLEPGGASLIHAMLREMGERVLKARDTPRRRTGEKPGQFKQPEPEQWTVRGRRDGD